MVLAVITHAVVVMITLARLVTQRTAILTRAFGGSLALSQLVPTNVSGQMHRNLVGSIPSSQRPGTSQRCCVCQAAGSPTFQLLACRTLIKRCSGDRQRFPVCASESGRR
ncbi:hypothetical protein QBC40DRAFT_288139 [Triangularia verruculosa]|uniref:Uncharacterized protein n=1 Tax=Triangularia verruculosa TaxID=2587418 RepID=A0AAN6X894_9PEZI|nr:hypothetical protein QBC40DRAFT_288139 [Triangularia verruculosa]